MSDINEGSQAAFAAQALAKGADAKADKAIELGYENRRNLTGHEAECALRYQTIISKVEAVADGQTTMGARIDRIYGMAVKLVLGLIVGLLGIIGFLLTRMLF